VTNDSSIQVTLNQALKAGEKLQFAVATGTDSNGTPMWGEWREATTLSAGAAAANGQVVYTAAGLARANGSNWINARVVLIGDQYTGGVGNSNVVSSPMQFILDSVAPIAVTFQLQEDKGSLSTSDGITVVKNAKVVLSSSALLETGASVQFMVRDLPGTANQPLQRIGSTGKAEMLIKGQWYAYNRGDQFILQGDTATGDGKVMLVVRQIDQAGNFTENAQTFVTDTTRVIEQGVALASAQQAVEAATKGVADATAAYAAASSVNKQQAQQALDKSKATLSAAQDAEVAAVQAARAALLKPDGATRLEDLGIPLDKDYLPAVTNALAANNDPAKVDNVPSLQALVEAAKVKADAALAIASAYDGTNAVPTAQDFLDMGVDGISAPASLALVKSALASLSPSQSDSVAEIQATANAANKLLALANGKADSPTVVTTPADYAALGVATPLTEAAATVLGQVIDRLPVSSVDSIVKLDALAAAAQRILAQAAQPAGQSISPPLSAADFDALGIAGVSVDNVAEIAQALTSVPPALRDKGQVVGPVDTLAEVKAIVANNIGSLQFIINFADGVTPFDPARPFLSAPTATDYNASGLSITDLGALNSAVDTLSGVDVGSWKRCGKSSAPTTRSWPWPMALPATRRQPACPRPAITPAWA